MIALWVVLTIVAVEVAHLALSIAHIIVLYTAIAAGRTWPVPVLCAISGRDERTIASTLAEVPEPARTLTRVYWWLFNAIGDWSPSLLIRARNASHEIVIDAIGRILVRAALWMGTYLRWRESLRDCHTTSREALDTYFSKRHTTPWWLIVGVPRGDVRMN